MRILIRTDVHLCQYSSILRLRGTQFSTRLEGVMKSVSWSEKMAEEHKCDYIVDMGDFFDKATLNAEEISTLDKIEWSKSIPHIFLIGNHEIASATREFNSTQLFNLVPNISVMRDIGTIDAGETELVFLPYILESDRSPLTDLLKPRNKKRVVFSHNDLKGIQMGPVVSTQGFEIDDIESNCDLFVNGHLHNGMKITDKIINLGNLTGQNFSEDALRYSHNIMILDTDTLTYELVENPNAFNFYKLGSLSQYTKKIEFKPNSIVSCSCNEAQLEAVKESLKQNPSVITSQVTVERQQLKVDESSKVSADSLKMSDHRAQFRDYIINKYGSDEIVLSELEEVLR